MQQAATVLGGSPPTVDRRNSDYVTAFHPDGRIILPCSTLYLRNGRYAVIVIFYRPTVLQLQQTSDPAKSVYGRKSISVQPYPTRKLLYFYPKGAGLHMPEGSCHGKQICAKINQIELISLLFKISRIFCVNKRVIGVGEFKYAIQVFKGGKTVAMAPSFRPTR